MTEHPHFRKHVTLERNHADGCVCVGIGDAEPTCVPPEKARDIANGLEHINRIGAAGSDSYDPNTEQLIADLREMANDVADTGGETDE